MDADVVVVGAGVVGAATALALTRAGRSVCVVDPEPGAGASHGNAGLVVPSYAAPFSRPEVLREAARGVLAGRSPVTLAAHRSLPRWGAAFVAAALADRSGRREEALGVRARRSRDLWAALHAEGLDLGWRQDGWLWARRAPHTDLTGGRLDGAAARELEPELSWEISGGEWFPDDAALDPRRATAALLQASGAQVVRARATLVPQPRGVAVRTEAGELRARACVVAAGVATAGLLRPLGVRVPVLGGWGWSVTLPGGAGLLGRPLLSVEDHVVLTTTSDGLRLTGGMRLGGPLPHDRLARAVARLRRQAERLVPAVAGLGAGQVWQGARPMTPDGVPLVREVLPGVVVATGHGTLGVTLAPGTAQEVVALVAGA